MAPVSSGHPPALYVNHGAPILPILFFDHSGGLAAWSWQAGNKIDFRGDACFFKQLFFYFYLDLLTWHRPGHQLGADQKAISPRHQLIPVSHFRDLHQQFFDEVRGIGLFPDDDLILITSPQHHARKFQAALTLLVVDETHVLRVVPNHGGRRAGKLCNYNNAHFPGRKGFPGFSVHHLQEDMTTGDVITSLLVTFESDRRRFESTVEVENETTPLLL